MKDNDTQHDTIVSKTEMSLTGPVLIIDMDLNQVPREDLLALLLLEEERKAEAEDNIRNIRGELFNRVEHGKQFDMWKHDQLGGDMNVSVAVVKKHIKARRTFSESQVIRALPKAFVRDLVTTKRVKSLNKDLFLELVDEDPVLNIACGSLVREIPETYRLEIQRVKDWLKLRRLNE